MTTAFFALVYEAPTCARMFDDAADRFYIRVWTRERKLLIGRLWQLSLQFKLR